MEPLAPVNTIPELLTALKKNIAKLCKRMSTLKSLASAWGELGEPPELQLSFLDNELASIAREVTEARVLARGGAQNNSDPVDCSKPTAQPPADGSPKS